MGILKILLNQIFQILLATVKPISKKIENINYTYYDNNSGLLKPSTNANYYNNNNTTDFYSGLNTTNVESIPNLISSTTNNINNINISYII